MKKKVLIVSKNQFGYHTDTYKYCEHLHNIIDFTFVCFDLKYPYRSINNVNVIYSSTKGNYFKRAINYFKNIYNEIKNNNYEVIFIVNFDLCFIIKFFSKKPKYILDIRTAEISRNKLKRIYHNTMMYLNILFFKNISIVSDELAKKFRIKKYFYLPLGADIISNNKKVFKNLSLLYVGTLNNRNIYQTVEGLTLFLKKKSNVNLTYDIIGYGNKKEVNKLLKKIYDLNLNNVVFFHGPKFLEEIIPFFYKCNIGISYIPITSYYDMQPATKTFEYLLSGMPCIATNTQMNRLIINKNNGVLCNDTPESFANAIEEILNNLDLYDSTIIRDSCSKWSWRNICNFYFLPIIEK